jgi:hypothetical protein
MVAPRPITLADLIQAHDRAKMDRWIAGQGRRS